MEILLFPSSIFFSFQMFFWFCRWQVSYSNDFICVLCRQVGAKIVKLKIKNPFSSCKHNCCGLVFLFVLLYFQVLCKYGPINKIFVKAKD